MVTSVCKTLAYCGIIGNTYGCETWARFHETLRRVVAQDTMRNASYLATRCKNDFTKLTMRSMHRKLLDNYAEHVARYDDRYSRLRM